MKIFGDPSLGKEIVDLLHEVDSAIAELDVQNSVRLCGSDVTFFDLNSQVHGLEAYEQRWNLYKPYMLHGVTIQRRDVNIYVESNLAFIHCYVKLTPADAEKVKWLSTVKWCRSTICVRKEQGQWKIVHQHVSVPGEFETGAMQVLDLDGENREANI
ncbi:nuclear transport factor 2 family protein [Acinetobacter sp. HR7]|uniref:YybH family protein n=1 Tax=Acinetobacter sp. HR7 TaxID=1509403 RepID=UPI0005536C1C|nr:nuclear transport factor 2 family protein [Acinetobacter sp. HR7]